MSRPYRKGPRKGKNDATEGADPMKAGDPMKVRCTATNRRGEQCGKSPIPGGTVCRMHGGAAPQVQQKARERLEAYQNKAIDRLFQLVEQTMFPSTAFAAVRDVLDRTMGKPTEAVSVDHTGQITIRHELTDD